MILYSRPNSLISFIYSDETGLSSKETLDIICSQVDRKKFIRAVKLVLFNQIVVGGAVSLVLYPVYAWRGCSFTPELPGFHWVLFEIAVFTLVEEVGFYYSHR